MTGPMDAGATPRPRIPRARAVAGAVAGASLLMLLGSVGAMIGRVQAFYEQTEHTVPFFRPLDSRSFTVHDRPVTITDEPADNPEAVVVRYGDREVRLKPGMPPLSAQLPGLARHQAWLAVLLLADTPRATGAATAEAIDRGEIPLRLIIVARDAHLELEGTAHGRGRPSDWTFDIHELLPDGSIRSERYGYPLSRRAARVAEARQAGAVPPLREGTWQYYAALLTIPRGSKPTPAFTQDAVRAMGWTLPAAAFSGLVLTLSLAWFLAPR